MEEQKKIEIDIKMTFEDMYRFNLYHTYHTSQGILSVVLACMIVLISVLTWGEKDMVYNVLYLFFAVMLIVYVPLNLRAKAKRQFKASEALGEAIHYTFDEHGITTRLGDQQVTMPWKQLYKIVSTRRMVLLYGGRIRANVIPKNQLGDNYALLYELAKSHMDAYRFKMKQ